MAEADDPDEAYPGKIENRDGCIKMFSKKDLWLPLTNFTMLPKYGSINVVEGESQYHIFECRLKTGATFTVPLSVANLDDNASVCAILQTAKLAHGGSLDKDKITRGGARLNRFLLGLIDKYKNSPADHSPAIVMKHTGFITLNIRTISGIQRTVEAYVTGPDSLVSLSEADDMALDLIPRKWIGPPTAEKFKIPPNPGNDVKEYITEIMNFHGKNRASPLAVLGYSFLSMHKLGLHKRGHKLGVMHVIGPIATGKTTLRHQFEFISPHVEIEDGGQTLLMVKEDPSMSVHNLQQKVVESRHLIVQDPPLGEPEVHNSFLDMYYEGKIEVKGSMKRFSHNAQPSSGLLYIWAHEKSTLPKISVTSLSKGVFLIHCDNPLGIEKYNDLDKAWRAKAESAPRLFRTLLQNIDLDQLQTEANKLVLEYVKELSKEYSVALLNDANRLLKQYSLVQVAAEMFVEKANLGLDIKAEIQTYFVETCIPYILQLMSDRKTGSIEKVGNAEDELIKKIQMFSRKEFLCQVGIHFIDDESHFGFVQALYQGSRVLKDFILSICPGQAKKRVLHASSSELWFKRVSTGHTYGQSKGIQQHLCPISHLPNKLKRALLSKCQDVIDDSEVLDDSDNLKEKFDEYFDQIYCKKKQPSKEEDTNLLQTMKKLTKGEKRKLVEIANDMIRKREAGGMDENPDSSTANSETELDTAGSELGDKDVSQNQEGGEKEIGTHDSSKDDAEKQCCSKALKATDIQTIDEESSTSDMGENKEKAAKSTNKETEQSGSGDTQDMGPLEPRRSKRKRK